MAKLYVIGIGPGGKEHLTQRALEVLKHCQVIVGYTYYLKLIEDLIEGKSLIKTGMTGEIDRCKRAIEKVKEGIETGLVSTGDAGLYGMAGLAYELGNDIEIEVIPGVSSVFAAAAETGAPLMHDFCTISLSDLLTPWEIIEKRVEMAAQGDFVISLYNPKSQTRVEPFRNTVSIILKYRQDSTPVALVKNAGREGKEQIITTLANIDYDFVDMKTIVIIGNSQSYIQNGKIITPRGYAL
ncbi:precorrin-3B C(17)-methyltransferase [Deltaproteobacteria bacterium TL4]